MHDGQIRLDVFVDVEIKSAIKPRSEISVSRDFRSIQVVDDISRSDCSSAKLNLYPPQSAFYTWSILTKNMIRFICFPIWRRSHQTPGFKLGSECDVLAKWHDCSTVKIIYHWKKSLFSATFMSCKTNRFFRINDNLGSPKWRFTDRLASELDPLAYVVFFSRTTYEL